MANHALPTTTSLYTDVLTNLKDRIDDSLKMLDSVNTTPTSVPTNSIRWNSTTTLWEKYNGSSWISLAASYAINVLKSSNLVGGNSTTLLGSIPYQSNTDTTTLLAPNTTTTRKFLRQTGSGTNGSAPVWDTILASDVPVLDTSKITTGTLPVSRGGTGVTTSTGTGSVVLSESPTFTGTVTAPTFSGALTGNATTATTATTANALNQSNSYTVANMTSNGTLVVGVGGNLVAGAIYSDPNWGMMFRAKQSSPAMAEFIWMNSAGSELFRFNGTALTTNITGNATTATTAANADKLIGKNWYWNGQGGQPTWLWGGSDGTNMYVYNPANFVVHQASSLTNHQWASLGGSGYMRLSTGLVIQWGELVTSSQTGTITFPTSFPNYCASMQVSQSYPYDKFSCSVTSKGISTFNYRVGGNYVSGAVLYWFAIGY